MGRPSSELLLVAGRLEGRKNWAGPQELRFLATAHNIRLVDKFVTVRHEVIAKVPNRAKGGETYTSRTLPYPHQALALAAARNGPNIGMFMEQGTGKTKVALDRAGQLYLDGQITGLLVVSKKGVHRQWAEEEAPKHLGIPFSAFWWGQKGSSVMPDGHLQIFTINYDAIKFVQGQAVATEFCKRHVGQLMIVADESQEIKNDSSQRWKAMNALKLFSSHRMLATGTPIAKDLTDEWAQLKWLDEGIIGIRYKTTFRNEFCIMGGFENKSVIGHKDIERFKFMTAPYIFRATKADIGILPKRYDRWRFDLTPKQLAVMRQLKTELMADLDDRTVELENVTAVLGKCQQVASGFIGDEGELHDIVKLSDNPRIAAAFEWLDQSPGKAIIWCRYQKDVLNVHSEAERLGINHVVYYGPTSDKDRAAAKERFNHDPSCQLLIATAAAAGTGNNLQVSGCTRALYYSNSFNYIDRVQSEDRIHRIGTVGDCTYTDLIAKGSADNYILANLRKKKSLSNLVLDDIRELLQEI
jgi:SNF2 family DNA or RNA helicase